MDLSSFGENPAGLPLKLGANATAYWAFLPNPLPPDLEFDLALARTLSEATGALGELAGLAATLPNPHIFIRPFIRREAVASSRIEGTEADLADLYVYEAGQLALPGTEPAARDADVHEVLNYVRALDYGLERIADLPVSLRFVRELHERLMSGVRGERATPGEFRRTQNWIGPPGCTLNEATYAPPPAPEMREALGAWEAYLHADDPYPPLVRLAFIHYQFEAIHPFLDGNGRIGRLLLSLLAVHWNLLPQPLLYLSPFFERRRREYYDLLLSVSTHGTWREWVEFFLRAVEEQSRDAVHRARRLQDLQTEWRERLTEARASALLLRLMDSLFEVPIVSVPQATDILGVTYPSAREHVQRLVDQNILSQVGDSSYGKLYVAKDIVAALEDDTG
jgi:Fic family protein